MEITGVSKLRKLQKKNKGNTSLCKEINNLVSVLEESIWKTQEEIKMDRIDADCVHNDGFYFFDINIHRTLILIEFEEDQASIIWVGSHDKYETTFKNNKNVIKKWLKSRDYIS